MPSDTAAPLAERKFRRLDLSFMVEPARDPNAMEDAPPGPIAQRHIAEQLVDELYSMVVSYKEACLIALEKRYEQSPVSQEELDEIWYRHTQAVVDIERPVARLTLWMTTLSPQCKDALVYPAPKMYDTEEMVSVIWRLVDELNLPYRVQRVREDSPEHAALVDQYRQSRRDRIEDWIGKARRGANVHTQKIYIANLFEDWKNYKDEVKSREIALAEEVGHRVVQDFWLSDPDHRYIENAMDDVDEELHDLYELAFPGSFEEDSDDDSEPSNENEEENPEDAFEEDWESDDGIDVAWTAQDFQDLREQMAYPTNLTVDSARLASSENSSIFQDQMIDNQCAVCLLEYTEITELVRCHHVFCFECIVPFASGYGKCPKCRAAVDLHELKIYDIKHVNMGKDKGGDKDPEMEEGGAGEKGAKHADDDAKDVGIVVEGEIVDAV